MSSLFGNGKESIQRNRISLASLLESIENADEDDKIVSPQGNEEVEAQEKTSSEENHIDSQNPKESSSPQENQDTKPSSGNPQATTSGLFFRFQANSPSVSQFFNNSQMSQASTGQPKENSEGSKPFFHFLNKHQPQSLQNSRHQQIIKAKAHRIQTGQFKLSHPIVENVSLRRKEQILRIRALTLLSQFGMYHT
eukprot:TRINITY_DN8398_c0_g2_i2.p1 TRINITY_DN8398_c0_g2~~TRINITY_DN8398_c0_g2_i2.p1  ORF type:complete len:195 (+),score=29.54 TRINITY_DN8398_c0_g2_i2:142-726(+)